MLSRSGFHQSRRSRYQRTVFSIPVSKVSSGCQPSSFSNLVASIVARAIGDVGDQAIVRLFGSPQLIKAAANLSDDIDVASLVSCADVVGRSRQSFLEEQRQCARVIVDEQPIADVGAVAVNRQRPPVQGIEDRQGNELFRKLVRPIIVRAIGYYDRNAVGTMPGFRDMVGCGLGSGIGRARIVSGRLAEQADLAERSINLVGGNVDKAKALLF